MGLTAMCPKLESKGQVRFNGAGISTGFGEDVLVLRVAEYERSFAFFVGN